MGIWGVLGAGAVGAQGYGPGVIVATVRDAANRPLAGAVVAAVGPVVRTATSNGAGVVALMGLPAGTYDVSVSLSGYASFDQSVSVGSVTGAPRVIAPTLQAQSVAAPATAGTFALPSLGGALDPVLAHDLEADRDANVVAAGGGAGIALDGSLPYETRVELDGIPLAGGPDSAAVLRLRDRLGLAAIDVTSGPFAAGPEVRDAIGGTVNFRTPGVDDAATAGVDDGFDSTFGSYEHARVVRAFGNLAFAFDGVAGGGADRSASFKARYAFSPAASIDVATYGLAGASTIGTSAVTISAPAFSAGVRARLGAGTFEARDFASSLEQTASLPTAAAPPESARVRGVQFAYDLPFGSNRLGFAFDRENEVTTYAGSPAFAQTFTSLSARLDVPLAAALRLQVADALDGGTLVPARNDPQLALAFHAGPRVTLRAEAGSAFATAPDAVLALRDAASPALAPETAFGERFDADVRLDAVDRVRVSLYSERRFDTFAPLADAASRGAGLGVERDPARGFGGLVYAALDRSYAYGNPQPLARIGAGAFPFAPGEQSAEVPFAKARAALVYRTSATCASRFGTTLIGANNAFSTQGVALGDVSACLPLFGLVDVRVGENNLFGAVVRDPVLAPLFAPHEYVFSVGWP